uniref:Uncharacterized protein n=1 Tax=viral metagenome TaxID=1070528 RepID=A0A6C0H104_9ZZZZ
MTTPPQLTAADLNLGPSAKAADVSTHVFDQAQVKSLFGNKDTVKALLTDDVLTSLFRLNRPNTVAKFVALLSDAHVEQITSKIDANVFNSNGCKLSGECDNPGEKRSALSKLLNKAEGLKSYLSTLVDKAGEWTPTSIDELRNPVTGLNLLLANPVVAAVVMQKRKRDFEMARARVLPAASGFSGFPGMGGLNPSVMVQIQQRGGGYEGGENLPVEMRGGGRLLAAMKGGNFFLGTMGSPTSWRPITDSSFISVSLEAAYQNLKANLKASKGADLAEDTQNKVRELITALKAAEDAVKEKRDELNKFNTILSTQNLKDINKQTVTQAQITDMVKLYNDSMSRRQSLENKMFRVIVALGNQMQTVTV